MPPNVRILLFALIAFGFVVLNPIHLPFTLPWLEGQYQGTRFGDFLARNEGAIVIAGTVYFTAVMIPVYIWIFSRRRRQQSGREVRRGAQGVSAAERYRGPGGGKREPPSMRRRQRRRR